MVKKRQTKGRQQRNQVSQSSMTFSEVHSGNNFVPPEERENCLKELAIGGKEFLFIENADCRTLMVTVCHVEKNQRLMDNFLESMEFYEPESRFDLKDKKYRAFGIFNPSVNGAGAVDANGVAVDVSNKSFIVCKKK